MFGRSGVTASQQKELGRYKTILDLSLIHKRAKGGETGQHDTRGRLGPSEDAPRAASVARLACDGTHRRKHIVTPVPAVEVSLVQQHIVDGKGEFPRVSAKCNQKTLSIERM